MQHEFKICHDWWIIISVTDWNCWFGLSILDLMNKNCIFLIDWMDPLVWMKTQLLMQPKCAPSIPRRLWRHNIFYKIPFALNQTHYLSRTAPILDPLKSNRIWRHVSHIFALMNDLHSRNQYSKKGRYVFGLYLVFLIKWRSFSKTLWRVVKSVWYNCVQLPQSEFEQLPPF